MMNFTAQHYVKVAGVIRELRDDPVSKTDLIYAFVKMFEEDNPLFQMGLFWDECQPDIPDEESGHGV